MTPSGKVLEKIIWVIIAFVFFIIGCSSVAAVEGVMLVVRHLLL